MISMRVSIPIGPIAKGLDRLGMYLCIKPHPGLISSLWGDLPGGDGYQPSPTLGYMYPPMSVGRLVGLLDPLESRKRTFCGVVWGYRGPRGRGGTWAQRLSPHATEPQPSWPHALISDLQFLAMTACLQARIWGRVGQRGRRMDLWWDLTSRAESWRVGARLRRVPWAK